jgi:hypothetical protein
MDHCDASKGCQSGCSNDEPTIGPSGGGGGTGIATTNGTCGASNGNTVCGSWSAGSCCSAYGFW